MSESHKVMHKKPPTRTGVHLITSCQQLPHIPWNMRQVTTHKVYLCMPTWGHQQPGGDAEQGSRRSLLVLAAAGGMVLAVLLAAYDEEIEDDVAGG